MSVFEMIRDVVDESIELPPGINGFHLEPRCRVCRNDEVRKKVNDLLASGSSYAMILRALGDVNATTDVPVYNIAPPDPKWSKAEQAAYIPSEATLLFTSVHEVWPGHFLQFLHSNANPSKLEALWVGYGFAEGWAHYCEEMMYEKGLGKGDPEKHIGQITDALLRDVARFPLRDLA